MRLLMMSPNFHHLNLIDSKGSKVLIEQLVQMDRYCDALLVCTKGTLQLTIMLIIARGIAPCNEALGPS